MMKSRIMRPPLSDKANFAAAKAILWCDVMTDMYFSDFNSNASFDTMAQRLTDWFDIGENKDARDEDFLDEFGNRFSGEGEGDG